MTEPGDTIIELEPLGPGTVGTDGILRPPAPLVLVVPPPTSTDTTTDTLGQGST